VVLRPLRYDLRVSVEILSPEDDAVAQVVDVLCEAFRGYPVMRFVLGPDRPDYDAALKTLIGFFVAARVFRQEYLLGVREGGQLAAAAIVSRSAGPPPPPDFLEVRSRVWSQLGEEAQRRYEAFGAACAPFQIGVPHLHLNMIGIRRDEQGRGLGRLLLERIHELSRTAAESHGVTLNTEVETNVPLYEHFGYREIGRETVTPGLTTWGFYRPDEPDRPGSPT
jgi:GNAT superfamily N-acetyltransferase